MTNVIAFNRPTKPTSPAFPTNNPKANKNQHIIEAEDYYLADVAIGIEIAIHMTADMEAANFLMRKMEQSIKSRCLWISLNLEETRKYLDYLDIVNSQLNRDWRLAMAKFKYTG